ncbi:MAG: phage regulatory CII family protein [Pseudorhizobium pelagicum]|uniref:phage regulatory CII family protein n=1 Tax=Pseudorhizobium pelagicum TaxID=1509405 RepID=UPI003460E7EE
MSSTDPFLLRLKAAQRDLIEACGGIVRSGDKTGHSKSTVGRWMDPADPATMPLAAVRSLEIDCRQPFVTSVLAEACGRRLTDPDLERAAEVCVMQSHAEVMRQMAELAQGMAMAIADGRVTPAEATRVDRVASDIQGALSDLRSAFASVKAQGGTAASLRVVGDD